jgi:diguanylate cyclase (GGDEF)-like protein
MIIDVDRFKQVNDNHGHDAGDLALRDIAALLCGNIREVDVSGRWGGEEFMIICPETDLPHGLRLGERLRSLIENSCFGEICSVTASFGIAAFSEFRELEAILKAADNRLYQAKENGRNRVEPAVPSDDLGLSDSCGPAD